MVIYSLIEADNSIETVVCSLLIALYIFLRAQAIGVRH